MKRTTIISLVLVFLAVAVPLLVSSFVKPGRENNAASQQLESPSGVSTESSPSAGAVGFDQNFSIEFKNGSEISEISMAEYLIGAVAAEMPASFELGALQAQAVALRTYTLQKMLSGRSEAHPDADICSDSTCCAAWRSVEQLKENWGADFDTYYEKICNAVESTDGVCVTYEGQPAQAVFHSSSAGMTEESGAIWSASLPYLVPVESPEDEKQVPNYVSEVSVSFSDFQETVNAMYPEADFDSAPQEWIGDIILTSSGRVDYVTIGGVQVSGTSLRSMFGLRSTAVQIDVTDSAVVFTVTGYGHGVGMSQYGANAMAEDGSSWQEILLWYYPGTELSNASSFADLSNG